MSCSRITFLGFKFRMIKIISSDTAGAKKRELLIWDCFDDEAGSMTTYSIQLAKFLPMLIKKLLSVSQIIFKSLVSLSLNFSSFGIGLALVLKAPISFTTFHEFV